MDHIVLQGIVGSHAHGLARPNSDTDLLGVYLCDPVGLLGLNPPTRSAQTRADQAPENAEDSTLHELGKFLNLALKCNPTVSELLWLDEDQYLVRTEIGDELIRRRESFLSARGVRNAYLGYAYAQAARVRRDTASPARQEKAARHCWRLVHSAVACWHTGQIPVRVSQQKRCLDFAAWVAAGEHQLLDELLAWAEGQFTSPTPLPEDNKAGWRAADEWLREVRLDQLIATRR